MERSNFSFLQPYFSDYYQFALESEQNLMIAPRTSVIYARLTLEELIRWMYTYDSALSHQAPEKRTLEALMYATAFKSMVSEVPGLLEGLTSVRKNGNRAVHDKAEVLQRYAHNSLKNLFEFCKWMHYTYVDSEDKLPFLFDSSFIPTKSANSVDTIAAAKALEQELEATRKHMEEKLQLQEGELEMLRQQVQKQKDESAAKPHVEFKLNPSTEKETRKILIDVLLRESGWDPQGESVAEYEVSGMPNASGKGYVDYVLWGDDGLPLAVVEAKSSLHDALKGRQQAKLYADCLEKQFGRRPLIFCSNGYNTWFWDDVPKYPRRLVSGFFSKDELEWTIEKRVQLNLSNGTLNRDIAGRAYQERAIKRVSEAFDANQRKALLVMATGTGKTRTAIALVDLMMRQRWARRVLFLADRNALVIQAKNNFVKLLPNLSCVDITKEKEMLDTHRMVFSTYPTMMNKIDNEKIDGLLLYSPAHFDLIIIDEAHRSIYQKYQAIFSYFDALLIGLTATPKSDVDKNTYELFDLENHNPTDFYELDQAVKDGWLVPPKKIEVSMKFLSEGIKYNELSEEQQQAYEEAFYDVCSDTLPEEINAAALNKFVFNADTVDKVLNHLMRDGLKVEGGDKIGKTIIFAKNHKHAIFIEERFHLLFPHLGGHFIRVIDNYEDYAQSLLEDFSDVKKEPQIAVSVDMLDTGVDIPEILNLVFFKVVRSSTKFWQMIGRGTRLCPNIFGPSSDHNDRSNDKKEFLIFDYCGNFEFFGINPDGFETRNTKSLSQRILETQILLSVAIDNHKELNDEVTVQLYNKLNDRIHKTITALNRNSFLVKAILQDVDVFSKRSRCEHFSSADVSLLFEKITPLAESLEKDEAAKRFDVFMLDMMLALYDSSPNINRSVANLQSMATALLKKTTIPIVKQTEGTLRTVLTQEFWQEQLSVSSLEHIREELRDLIHLLEKEKRTPIYSNIEDELDVLKISEALPTYTASENYKQRVEKYVRENENHLVIHKLKHNQPVTNDEIALLEQMLFDGKECGTKDEFVRVFGDQPLGYFIRSIVGLDINAAKQSFADFLNAGNLSANQIHFVDMIIDYLSKNGVIDAKMLYEPPFTNYHIAGVSGLFDDNTATKLIAIVREINDNAVA